MPLEHVYHFCRKCGSRSPDMDSGRVDGTNRCIECGEELVKQDVTWLIDGTKTPKGEADAEG